MASSCYTYLQCSGLPGEFRGPKIRRGPLRAKRAENFQGLETKFGKLLLVYFMRPSDLEALGVMRLLGVCGPGAICPRPPPPFGGPGHTKVLFNCTKK